MHSVAGLLSPREVPLLTPQLPGTSGLVRVSEQDFRVEELPLYEARGEGGHLLLLVEKSGRTTPEVARELAIALAVREREIALAGREGEVGDAGLKEKREVAVQRLSVPVLPGRPEFGRRGVATAG